MSPMASLRLPCACRAHYCAGAGDAALRMEAAACWECEGDTPIPDVCPHTPLRRRRPGRSPHGGGGMLGAVDCGGGGPAATPRGGAAAEREAPSELDVLYLKNVLLKFIQARLYRGSPGEPDHRHPECYLLKPFLPAMVALVSQPWGRCIAKRGAPCGTAAVRDAPQAMGASQAAKGQPERQPGFRARRLQCAL